MDLLTELMRVKRIEDEKEEKEEKEPDLGAEENPEDDGEDLSNDEAGEDGQDEEFDDDDVELGSDDPDFVSDPGEGAGYPDAGGEDGDDGFEDPELDDIAGDDAELEGEGTGEPEDPNRAGVIRYVKGAHLVYKREQEDGTYEEMWIFKSKTLRDDMELKKNILAGTDIPVDSSEPADGEQSVDIWNAGDAYILKISGLPN